MPAIWPGSVSSGKCSAPFSMNFCTLGRRSTELPESRNHHNAELQAKARELGLVVDRRGVTGHPSLARSKSCSVSAA